MAVTFTPRRFREEGHRRKFLAIVDDTPECARAVHYAARRAAAIGNGLALARIVAPGEFGHWLGVEKIMRDEKLEEAEALLAAHAGSARDWAPGVHVSTAVVEGESLPAVGKLIEEDRDIAIMVLAAGEGSEGPGPLVSAVVGRAFPIPVTIVPATLSDEDIEDLI